MLAGIQILLLSISTKVGIMESYEGFTVKMAQNTSRAMAVFGQSAIERGCFFDGSMPSHSPDTTVSQVIFLKINVSS